MLISIDGRKFLAFDMSFNVIFYKERTIAKNGLDQRLIVTFSLKYQDYMRALRERKIKRAQKMIETGSYKLLLLSDFDH